MRPLLAALTATLGLTLVLMAVTDGGPGPEPIPLVRTRVATPLPFPTTPPIRRTPAFIDTAKQPNFVPQHRDILMRWAMPPKIDVLPGMH